MRRANTQENYKKLSLNIKKIIVPREISVNFFKKLIINSVVPWVRHFTEGGSSTLKHKTDMIT